MTPRPPLRLLPAYAVATVLGCGLSPFAPGTVGSLAAVAAYLPLRHFLAARPELFLAILAAVALGGVWAARAVSRAEGNEDPSKVVVDEVLGQLMAFFLLPPTFGVILLGFVAFRLFDIWKPYPIRRLEHIGQGVGIMADDALAGVYANLLIRICLAIPLVGSHLTRW